MTNRETRRYEMLGRVHTFGEGHRAEFQPQNPVLAAFDAVAAAIRQVTAQAIIYEATAQQGQRRKAHARAALETHLGWIVRCARLIARKSPGFDATFRVARPRSDETRLIVAGVFRRELTLRQEAFLGCGMPESFVSDLDGLLHTYEQAIRDWDEAQQRRLTARMTLQSALAAGLEAVRVLDVAVPLRFRDDPTVLAVWNQNRRVGYPRARRRATEAVQPRRLTSVAPVSGGATTLR